MKKFNWIIALCLSISLSSCGFITIVPMDSTGTGQSSPSSPTPSGNNKSTSPAPKTPLPAPSPKKDGSTTTRSDNNAEMEQFYKDLKLSDSQITKFKGIMNKYQRQTKEAKLKHKGNQIALNKALKDIKNQQEAEIKAMMSDYQYQNYLKVMKERSGNGTKGKIGG